ncbi:ArsR/SmtB family transcription factor [Paenibacillus taiwanensis]|uniref:ArsR/SmtB family transcription factor n=1 Tax=Paenibacillus taiwanensis TaxID=401638 RepID=UPI001FDF4437|nr:metalloregulator ArsR/SmtB family transcription factor [Paenibacillus taiwanensis]
MSDQFKLLGDRTRMNIVSLLYGQELCVCQLVELMDTTQPNISQHLRKLKDAGLVREKRRGQWSYYHLQLEDKPHLQEIFKYVPSMNGKIKDKLSKLSCEIGA